MGNSSSHEFTKDRSTGRVYVRKVDKSDRHKSGPWTTSSPSHCNREPSLHATAPRFQQHSSQYPPSGRHHGDARRGRYATRNENIHEVQAYDPPNHTRYLDDHLIRPKHETGFPQRSRRSSQVYSCVGGARGSTWSVGDSMTEGEWRKLNNTVQTWMDKAPGPVNRPGQSAPRVRQPSRQGDEDVYEVVVETYPSDNESEHQHQRRRHKSTKAKCERYH